MVFFKSMWKIIRWISSLILRLIPKGNDWQEIHVSSGMRPEPTLRRHSYLQSKGIRCRLRNLSSPNPRMNITGMISLRVYRDDAGKAFALLREFKD